MMRILLIIIVSCLCATTFAQELDDDLPAPGLVASFQDEHGNRCQRVDEEISFAWRDDSPDRRIGTGKFEANWKGRVLLRAAGEYRFRAFVQGKVTVKLDGQEVLSGTANKPAWLTGEPIVGRAGFRDLEIHFAKTLTQAQLVLSWSGPGFPAEPISSSLLFHERASIDDDAFDRGRQLVRALRCTACHDIPTALPVLHGPSLETVGGNIEPAWIVDWLVHQVAEPVEDRQMPHIGLSLDEARAIAAFLTANAPATRRAIALVDGRPDKKKVELPKSDEKKKSGSTAKSASSSKKKNSKEKEKHRPSVAGGERLVATLGCLACHRVGDLGSRDLIGGGQLSRIGEKHPSGFFAQWLQDPATINRHHRMPKFELSSEELIDLELFLASQVAPDFKRSLSQAKTKFDAQLVDQGRKLVVEHRCEACHALPSDRGALGLVNPRAVPRTRLAAMPRWSNSCLVDHANSDQRKSHQPWYPLAAEDESAVKHYIQTVGAVKNPAIALGSGADLLESSNCLACHPRGLGKGISDTANAVAKKYEADIEHIATLIPPSLNSIGDKLRDEALKSSVLRSSAPLRSWLRVRMPKYTFASEETEALTQLLIDADRVPETLVAAHERMDDLELRTVGARLVTSDGFGCTSCHAVNDTAPGASPINARGPNLGSLGKRVRPEWFYRWVANPLRIVPRVEMPSITTAVPGVLDGDLDRQIHAVWDVLNLDGFKPPMPNPVRIVRRLGLADVHERAAFLTDVLRMGEAQWVKPMLVGLENRHNVLINLETFQLDAWWIGDAARQRTAGKTWFWEAGSDSLWKLEPGGTDLVLEGIIAGKTREIAPEYIGQFRAELDQWEHIDHGVKAKHRLHFAMDPDAPNNLSVVNIEQEITSLPRAKDLESGWKRTIRLSHIPKAMRMRLKVFPGELSPDAIVAADCRSIEFEGVGDKRVRISDKGAAVTFDQRGSIVCSPDADGSFELSMDYTTSLPVDSFPSLPEIVQPEVAPMELHVVPGFKAMLASLPGEIMPTGFAWEPNGSMIVTSLRGNVWRAKDTNRDGLYDSSVPISDELAAPFGAAATAEFVDVINKYGLLRLWDDDRDGFAERTETVASGWGHTADYHDWALGLPRTAASGYLVTISCQQDERSAAAAYLRGTVVQLLPRKPTREDPHPFSVELFSGGHRFPIGIAMDRSGEAFVTDNQGNYNPFNELNHLRLGARYGFINANEKSPGFEPRLTPPAIDIPHPWTRSVNGICFLNSPDLAAGSVFGPFEGHLIGCEYDTQRLVRMTLYRVGDTIQGTAYPFSYDTPRTGPPLLGPISCAVSPAGELVVGNIRDSGWGAGQNTGNIVQMRYDPATLPAGIAEIRAERGGFRIAFTKPVSPAKASDKRNYAISSFTRTSTPEYGGDDQQRSEESIVEIQVSPDSHNVFIQMVQLKRDFVYEFHLDNLTADNSEFFPAEAFATLRVVP